MLITGFIASILVFAGTAFAQIDSALNKPDSAHFRSRLSDSVQFSTTRFTLVTAGSAGIITLAHLQNYNAWWKGDLVPFHLSHNESAELQADKLGHFYFTFLMSDITSRSLIWSGVKRNRAYIYGGGLALAFQLYVEIEDAFHPNLGFSPGDALADLAGAALPLLQEHYSFLQPISFKWSAIPSHRYKSGEYRTLVDDYESQYYWISVNLQDALGSDCPVLIPSFLNIAIGYGVKNLDKQGNGTPEVFLSLDCDMRKLPGDGEFLSTVKHVLNYLHLPAPTIRLTPEVTFYGVRF